MTKRSPKLLVLNVTNECHNTKVSTGCDKETTRLSFSDVNELAVKYDWVSFSLQAKQKLKKVFIHRYNEHQIVT